MLAPVQTLLEVEDNRLWHVAWSPDGTYLAACGSNRSCAIFRVPENIKAPATKVALLQDSHSRTIRCCEFSPAREDKRTLLATASFDATVVIWELKERPENAFSQDEEKWEPIATLDGHENEVKCVSWSFDGQFLATSGRDKTCWVWELVEDDDSVEEWRCVSVLTGHDGDVKQVRFHPSRYLLASCSYDNSIRLWEYADGENDFVAVATLDGHANTVWACCFATANMLVSCSQDLTLKTWGRRQVTETEEFVHDGDESWDIMLSIASRHTRTIFSMDMLALSGWLVTGGGDNAICLRKINTENGFIDETRALLVSDAHEQDVNCVRFRPGSTEHNIMLASAGDDGQLKLWAGEVR